MFSLCALTFCYYIAHDYCYKFARIPSRSLSRALSDFRLALNFNLFPNVHFLQRVKQILSNVGVALAMVHDNCDKLIFPLVVHRPVSFQRFRSSKNHNYRIPS